jgi:beta-glucosidase
MKLNLPKEFIWGTATAAHQVEGNNTNSDFWLLENTKKYRLCRTVWYYL